MAYTGWELGFESSRSGAARESWPRQINLFTKEASTEISTDNYDERERGFESSRTFRPVNKRAVNTRVATKKLSRCVINEQPLVLLDTDLLDWER